MFFPFIFPGIISSNNRAFGRARGGTAQFGQASTYNNAQFLKIGKIPHN